MRGCTTKDTFTTTDHTKLTPEEREQTKELRRMHIGEHAERSWPFESEVRTRLAESGCPVDAADHAAKMLREVMFWGIKVEEDRDFWVYRVFKCHKGCDPNPEKNCCWHKVGLSRRNVESARELLDALDLLEYTSGKGLSTGFHNRTHYRVTHTNMLNLLDFLEKPLLEKPKDADQHSRFERTHSVGTNVHTLTESTDRENVQSKYLHEKKNKEETYSSSPLLGGRGGGVGVIHEREQTEYEPTSPREPSSSPHTPEHALATLVAEGVSKDSTTVSRDPEPEPLGERIARSVEARLDFFYGHQLTDEEFATVAKDANSLHSGGIDLAGLYKASDVLVEDFARTYELGSL